MIIIRLMGGLGNQMFQYAFGLYTALHHDTILKIDTSLLQNTSNNSLNYVHRKFELDVFNLNINFASNFEIELFNGIPDKNVVRRGFFKVLRKMCNIKTYIQDNHNFSIEQLNLPNNTCIIGRWQTERYFKFIENEIREQFTFKNNISNAYQPFKEQILISSNATCIHIRRTDYVHNSLYAEKIGALPDVYYLDAINKLNKIILHPELFIFSDDIEYTKALLEKASITNKITFVQTDKTNPHDELQLMTLCSHFIISNSTFSWWGAWLSSNHNKLIIAPENWSKDSDHSSKYILPSYFEKIPVIL